MSQSQADAFLAIALGFAFAGLIAAIYRAWRQEPVQFELLLLGGRRSMVAIPLLVAAGPAVIMRNTLRGRKFERRKAHFVAMATILASFWSMAIGYQLMNILQSFAG
ncbi:hypothetical protein MCEMSEM23_00641 [Rhabdaerophilaceae bacterium]